MEEELDEDYVPKHAVLFKLQFEIEQTAIEDYNIVMKFIDPDNEESGV